MTLTQQITSTPAMVRALPFGIFLVLTFAQQMGGDAGKYWFYLGKTVVGIWLILTMRPLVAEMKWNVSWEAVVIGVGACVMWIGFEYVPWGRLGGALGFGTMHNPHPGDPPKMWNPLEQFSTEPLLAWFFIVVRTLGSTFVVPPLEETFYRSFLYRYTIQENFQEVPLNRVAWWPMIFTAGLFASTHGTMILPAILFALAMQWLVIRKCRLGDAITAHAITNFLLSIWVVWRGDWVFW